MTCSDKITLTVVAVVGIVWLILEYFLNLDIILCPTKILFGIPCPGCGMTRACLLLLHNDIIGAFCMNPNVFVLALFVVGTAVCVISSMCKKSKSTLDSATSLLKTRQFLIPFVISELIIWSYNIIRHI